MNNLLLLAGIVLVVCLMNSKDLMNSDLVKSVSSKSKSVSKSLGVDSTTLLVVVFVGAVLFMCMSKGVEGFTLTDELGCPRKFTKMHVYDPKDTDEKNHAPVCFNPSDMKVFKDAIASNNKVATPMNNTNIMTDSKSRDGGNDGGSNNNSNPQ